ncbi:MAG: hypothetical protein IT174_15860 [Acidobacteria bacterium]|nr:hypothetical protein [Acidobacteriota bacterium]
MERVFQITALGLAAIAAYFLWRHNNDGAFIAAVLGCLSFFLSIRAQVKERNRLRSAEAEAEAGENSE